MAVNRLVDWLVDLIDRMVDLVDWLVDWVVGLLVDLVEGLVNLVEWLVGLVDWLVDNCPVVPRLIYGSFEQGFGSVRHHLGILLSLQNSRLLSHRC